MPAYNAAPVIERAITSALAAVPGRVEVIAVDDASTDDTADVLAALARDHPALTVLRHERNAGAGAARNTGLPLASGTYLAFLDADDRYLPGHLATVLDLALDARPDVLVHSYAVRRHDGVAADLLALDPVAWTALRPAATSGPAVGALRTLAEVPQVLRLAGFPWNKLIARSHAQRLPLRFSTTPVFNDVFAHWQSLLSAGSILVADLPVVEHVYDDQGLQLTNVHDRRRIDSLSVLDEVAALFAQDPGLSSYEPFFRALEADILYFVQRRAAPSDRTEVARRYLREQGQPTKFPEPAAGPRRRLILYGRDWEMLKFHDALAEAHDVVAFLDDDLIKAGRTVFGRPVCHPEQDELPPHDLIVLCSRRHLDEMGQTLTRRGWGPHVSVEDLLPGAFLL